MFGMTLSTAVFGQTDVQLSAQTTTAVQKQAILANVQDRPEISNQQFKVAASCDSLTVQTIGGNGYNGNMFDIAVTSSVTLETFSVSMDAGTWNVAIFYKTGTFVGSETSSTGWIFLDSANITSTTTDSSLFYKVPVNINLPLTAGTYAFYVTGTNSAAPINYTNGTAVGNTFSSNAYFAVKEGNGGAYPFSVTNSPRVFNGEVFFCAGLAGVEDNTLATFDMYPNPAEQSVSVDLAAFNGNNVTLSIMNTLGQRMQSTSVVANGVQTLNVDGYATGMYFVQVEMNGKTATSKLTIK